MGLKEKADAKPFEVIDPRLKLLQEVKVNFKEYSYWPHFKNALRMGLLDIFEELMKMNPTLRLSDPNNNKGVYPTGKTTALSLYFPYKTQLGKGKEGSVSIRAHPISTEFDFHRNNDKPTAELPLSSSRNNAENFIVDLLNEDNFFGKKVVEASLPIAHYLALGLQKGAFDGLSLADQEAMLEAMHQFALKRAVSKRAPTKTQTLLTEAAYQYFKNPKNRQ